jgi:biotin synthase
MVPPEHRNDWTEAEAEALFDLPFADLVFMAQTIHRRNFDPNQIQISQLLSIKTGGCPEDCGYCGQSVRSETGAVASKLMTTDAIVAAATAARAAGAQRFCMGAAWRSPKDKDVDAVCDAVAQVKALGLETCVTLGMLTDQQADRLAEAGLDYYNHNIDTSPEYYEKVITTRTFDDRLQTLARVRRAGLKVCCGGIVGMGEARVDRVGMLLALANLPEHPQSVPINSLMRVPGTKLAKAEQIGALELVRTVAVARVLMPAAMIRLSAGREHMSDELQALCFLVGANSIFVGETLLTTPNPSRDRDRVLLARLGMRPMAEAGAAKA